MLNKKIKAYLKENNVDYDVVKHSPAYTAAEIASAAHIRGKELAKTVMVKVDGKLAMVIEPANIKVDLGALQELIGAKNVTLARESEFEQNFPECETGAQPPFGQLWDVDVYEDERVKLSAEDDIAFNAGNHSELIKMKYKDFEQLVKPKHLHLG